MSSLATILLFNFLLLTTTTTVTATSDTEPLTMPEMLEEYIFPIILPSKSNKVKYTYTLNLDTGEFKVHPRDTIGVYANHFKLRCKSTITGVMISKDTYSVTKLEGVSIKVGDYWADIKEIIPITDTDTDIDTDAVRFEVGVRSTEYSITNQQRGWRLCCKVLGFVKDKMKLLIKWLF